MGSPTAFPSSDQVPAGEPSSATASLLLLAFVILASFLRLYNFWIPDLWVDEYVTRWVAAAPTWEEAAQRGGTNNTQSPFYYFVARQFTQWFGLNHFALRLPSILLGIGVVVLAYPLGLAIFQGRYPALVTVAVFSVNSWLIWYSQDARPYSLALFCSMISFISYLMLRTRQHWLWRVAYMFSTAAAYYAHPLFGCIAAIQGIHLVLHERWTWPLFRTWSLTFLGIVILCLPTLPRILSLYKNRQQQDWIMPVDWTTAINTVFIQFIDPIALSVVVLALLFMGFRTDISTLFVDAPRRSLILLWFLLPLAGFALIPLILGVSLLEGRYVLFALPGALIITAWVIALGSTSLWRQWLLLAIYLAFVMVVNLLPLFHRYGVFTDRPEQGWDRATAFLTSLAAPEDLILYSTSIVEADQFPFPPEDGLIQALIETPLTANLPPHHPYALLGLPYRINDVTRPYVSSVIRRAGRHQRVWLIGIGQPLTYMADQLAHEGYRRGSDKAFGSPSYARRVRVLLLERAEDNREDNFTS
jgi:4-amino-4-deoxy-L-arabinose transferase-like glycosyltransferase